MLRVEGTSNSVTSQQPADLGDFEITQAVYRTALKSLVESMPYSKRDERDAIFAWMGRQIYPSLGRSLSTKDVGQDVVRVIPQKKSESCSRTISGLIVPQPQEYDYSYCPRHDDAESFIRSEAIKVASIVNGRMWYDDPRIGRSSRSYKPDENVWCTVEEFLAFREQNPGRSVSLQEYYGGARVSS